MTLQEYMTQNSLTDAAMAQRVGVVGRSYITLLRLKKRHPSLPVALKIAEVTDGEVSTSAWSESHAESHPESASAA